MIEKQGPRARDADRNAVVEELQGAFIDGQIDADEREHRTALALAATHLVDLEPLLSDLQVSKEPDRASQLPEQSGSHPAGKALRKHWLKGLAAAGVAVAAVIALGSVTSGPIPTPSMPGVPVPGDAHAEEQQTVQWSEVSSDLPEQTRDATPDRVPGVGHWSVTQDKVRALLDHYRSELGTPYFGSIWLSPDRAEIARPLRGGLPRTESWTYDDAGFAPSSPQGKGRDMTLMDLRDLDLDKLFANINYALDELDAPETQILYVSVSLWMGEPQVAVYVTDPVDGSNVGYLHTTLAGTITADFVD